MASNNVQLRVANLEEIAELLIGSQDHQFNLFLGSAISIRVPSAAQSVKQIRKAIIEELLSYQDDQQLVQDLQKLIIRLMYAFFNLGSKN